MYVQGIHTKIYVFTRYASMYAVNAIIKILVILTKAVIPLAFSKILPEASCETAKTTKFEIKQRGHGEIS